MLQNPEQLWDEFVPLCGGERVRDLIPSNVAEKNADYIFRQANVIAELKSLERETFTPAYYGKLNAMTQEWMRKRWIIVYGRVQISLRNLPKPCQQEWLRLLETPLQRLIAHANRQIKSTKKLLDMPSASGVLVLASAGNRSLTPHDLISLVKQILQKRHPDGALQYSALDDLVYFSVPMPVIVPTLPAPAFCWFSGYRQPKSAVTNFIADLHDKWYKFLEQKTGRPLPRVPIRQEDFEHLKFV